MSQLSARPAQGTGRITWTVGRLHRRDIRRFLDRIGARYAEEKGLLDSQFVVTTTCPEMHYHLLAWFTEVTERLNASD